MRGLFWMSASLVLVTVLPLHEIAASVPPISEKLNPARSAHPGTELGRRPGCSVIGYCGRDVVPIGPAQKVPKDVCRAST
ncbi:MAG: hypothetical protein ABI379_02770, partial [Rhodanobacter sp.]